MAKNIRQYDVLISCPSDVQEELKIIKNTVDDFNRMYGIVNNARLNIKHWSKDSYPKSGGRAQSLLNEQFILDCDAAIAIFWTRFGTPTEEYGSGSEEEIEKLMEQDKQVFVYFSDAPINPSVIDNAQYQRVKSFRKKYENEKGIYYSYSCKEDFSRQLLNHLSLHFLKEFVGDDSKAEILSSDLCVKGIVDGKTVDIPRVILREVLDSKFIAERKESIENKCKSIVNISSIKKTIEISKSVTNKMLLGVNENIASLMSSSIDPLDMSMLYEEENVVIQDDLKSVIIKYFRFNNKDINEEEFFCIGDLKERKEKAFITNSSRPLCFLVGHDYEKEKYKLIKQLSNEIIEYEQFIEYFTFIDSKFYLSLALCNIGKQFDEDIDVKVYLEKGMLFSKENIPVPGDNILSSINSMIDSLFVAERSVDLQRFDGYSLVVPLDDYKKNINDIFCFDFYEEAKYNVICFNQKYLKQNMNSCFPSLLILNEKPSKLKYEIRSKHCPDVIVGELEIN